METRKNWPIEVLDVYEVVLGLRYVFKEIWKDKMYENMTPEEWESI